jgi:short-subunit dehydrogenase
MDLQGASVLLTGASSGIGAATARALAKRGAVLGLVARRKDRLEAVLADCTGDSPDSRTWVADLSDLDAAEGVVREAIEHFGHLDVLLNNAGAPKRRHVRDLTPAEVEDTMRINFFSPARMMLAALPSMIERGKGMVVNVGSMAGRIGVPTESAYSASKFALGGWSEGVALDLHGTGVEIRLISPGAFETEIWDQPGSDDAFYDGPKAPPEECAEAIVEAIEGSTFETYAPAGYRDIVVDKTRDFDQFMAMVQSHASAGSSA